VFFANLSSVNVDKRTSEAESMLLDSGRSVEMRGVAMIIADLTGARLERTIGMQTAFAEDVGQTSVHANADDSRSESD
jgi:hypothetical protein